MPLSRRLGKILLGLAVSVGLRVYFFWDVDLRAIAARLRETLWTFLALSVALNFFSLWVRALRWSYLFPPRTLRVPAHLGQKAEQAEGGGDRRGKATRGRAG